MTELVCQVNRSTRQAPQNPHGFAPSPQAWEGPVGPGVWRSTAASHHNPPEVKEKRCVCPTRQISFRLPWPSLNLCFCLLCILVRYFQFFLLHSFKLWNWFKFNEIMKNIFINIITILTWAMVGFDMRHMSRCPECQYNKTDLKNIYIHFFFVT